jgi:hypothetical protein
MTKPKTKIKQPPFTLEEEDCVMKGLSMSFDCEGDEHVSRRTLTLDGIVRKKAHINAHLGAYTHESWFNTDAATKHATPMPFWQKIKSEGIELNEKFDLKTVQIKCGSRILKFKSEKHESDDGEKAAGKIKDICYVPQAGGVAIMSLKLSVCPDADQAAVLEEYFDCHIKVTFGELLEQQTAAQKSRQGELPVSEQGSGTPGGGDKLDEATTAIATGNRKPIDGTTAESRARSAAAKDGYGDDATDLKH